ncbi:uncharacterized protein LOC121681054 [Alosa sapidissima]|uniref:uncharacterized protein LOC121681054 n=1 Tax=Alosa sapidissima TaxID=34773 RepID=UPI001C09519C|nr:uncharacterized protein LOC121681054 [Alosa sapidissima]XP_041916615.1 uncharacterized protein LOC121681054 [Alosa sapidissima]XP_041916616.1 uncharacterized protein LOC121681054 [Alosa sapidissima]XP_041916617.1 uncharacterized protein LOC121681054 [Alosa sapidissima]XP_041916618.1 uncharacterized protein LOC121681054 [Alosa sapidissima]
METRCDGNRGVIPFLSSPHLTGTPKFKNFIIPRKKRASGIAVLEPCAKESRDYALIETTLRDLMLDLVKGTCKWGDAKLVHNDELLREFAEKRSEMRSKGRHLRETEERFCFLVASDQETTEIYQQGLKVEKTNQHSLGKPSHGVYLFRHVDVALKNPDIQLAAGKNMIIFKVLFGRVKKVAPSSVESGTQDPTIAFDCHMSRDSVSPRDSLPQQIIGSSVFLFDFNENHDLNTRPRQCLPYAVVPIFSVNLPTSASMAASPTELPPKVPLTPKHGPGESLKAFIVAERRGKGQSAMVTFKHFGTQGPHVTEPMHHEAVVERKTDYQNIASYFPFFPQLQAMNCFQNGPWVGFPPVLENSIQYGNTEVHHSAFLNQQSQMSAPRVQNEPFEEGDAKISTIVYSSKTVRDPRLSGRELGDPNRTTSVAPQTLGPMPEGNVLNAQKDLPRSQFQGNECRSTPAHFEAFPQNTDQTCTIDTAVAEISSRHKPEKLPSLKLFKMKFQKYALYFQMTESERIRHIWSRTDLLLDQKNLLLERIHYYEHYFEKYKRGLLFSGDRRKRDQSVPKERRNERNVYPTETHITSKHIDDKMIKQMCAQLRVQEQLESNSTHMQGQFDILQSRKDIATPEVASEQIKHVKFAPTAVHLIEKEHNALPNGHTVNKEQTVDGSGSSSQELKSLLLLSRVSAKHCGDLKISVQAQKQREKARTIPQDSPESSVEGPVISQSVTEAERMEGSGEEEVKEVSVRDPERGEVEQRENFVFENEGEFLDVGMCKEVCTTNNLEILTAPTVSPNQGTDIDLRITDSNEEWSERETFVNFKNSENVENCHNLKTDNLEVSGDTIYKLLYERLQLSQLLPNSTPTNDKPYLKPQCLDQTTTSINNNCDLPHVKKSDWEEHPMLGITIKSTVRDINNIRKPLTLSQRFSLLSCSKGDQPLSSLLKDYTQGDENKQWLTGSISSKTEEHISNFNIKLVKFLTQKYNECQLRTSHYKKLRKMSDFKSTIYHRRSKRFTSNTTLKKAFDIKRQYFKTLPRVDRKTKLNRTAIQKRKDTVFSKEPSHTTETRNEAELEQGVDGLEQRYRSKVFSSDNDAVEISNSHTECVPSTALKQPTDQSQNTEGQNSSDNCSTDRNNLSPDPSAMSKDSHKDVVMEGATNKDKGEVLQKVQDVTKESGSLEEVKCLYNETPAENAISADECLSHNINSETGIPNDVVLENNCNHSASLPQESTANLQTPLNAKESVVDSNVDNSYTPSLFEQKCLFDTDAQEVKLISKLRNYLTRFETTVKLQEPLDEIPPELFQQFLGAPNKADTAQTPLPHETQTTEVVNPECRITVKEQIIDLPNPGPLGDNLTSHSVTSTCQQNILPAVVSDPITTIQCVPVLDKSTLSLITHGPEPVPSLSPDSTTMLGTVLEKAIPYPLIELSRPKLPSEPQQMQQRPPDGDHLVQSTDKINGQSSISNNRPVHNTKTHSRQNSEDHQVKFEKLEATQGQKLYDKTLNTTPFQRHFNTADISNLLKEADCGGLDVLRSLLTKTKMMLQYFISNFERDQGVAARCGIVTRDIILDKYLHQPPAPFDLKYEALNSFLELQMMVEAKEFIENKMSYLTAKQTFRTLLWYDPSLHGELFKGRVGYQQQSCVYTAFQQRLAIEGYSKLQNYCLAVTTLNQQLKMAPQTSYYLYLKSKREKLEIEAALHNFAFCDNFFLSVPISSIINFGDNSEHLEKLQNRVISFVETPAEKMPGDFDVGKAEHLSIICRFLQEKINCVKTCKVINSQISWFGLEHLLYDASKILVARDMVHTLSQDNIVKFQGPNLIYGTPNPWLPMMNRPTQMPQSHGGTVSAGPQMDMNGSHMPRTAAEKKLYLKKRKSIGTMEKTPLAVKRRHSHPATGQNNEPSQNYIQPQVNLLNPVQFQPGAYSNNLLKQHAALWRRRTQDNPPPPPPPPQTQAPTAIPPGRQSHSHIRALLLAKQQKNIPPQQPSPSCPLPNNPAGKLMPPPLPTMVTPQFLPHAFQPTYEGVISPMLAKDTPQNSGVSKELKNPFTLGPLPSLQLPSSLLAPRPSPPAPHPSIQFMSSADNAAFLHEHAPLNYPFFVLNGCTYTSATAAVPNKAAPNDTTLNSQKS